MLSKKNLWVFAFLSLGLTACGQDEPAKSVPTAATAAPAAAEPVAEKNAVTEVTSPEQAEMATQTVEVASVTGPQLYAVCAGCHGAAGEGGVGPKLSGQSVADLEAKLHIYKAGKEIGAMSAMMIPNATGLSDDDIAMVAEYIAQF